MYSQLRTALSHARVKSNAMALTRSRAAEMATSSAMNLNVEHDPKQKLFFIKMNKDKAFIQYTKKDNDDIINLEHTVVPDAFGGRGVGKILAKHAFDYSVKNNLKMKLNCTFLQHYFDKYAPDYSKFVIRDGSR